jgi:hypothetical protein
VLIGATGLFVGDRNLGLVGLGLALVPFVFLVLAFGSRHPRASGAVLRAMGLFLVVGLPISGLIGPLIGMPAGYAVAAITALRPPEDHDRVGRARGIAVAIGLLYLVTMAFIEPFYAAFVGAVLPFVAVGLSDQAMDWRARERRARSERAER